MNFPLVSVVITTKNEERNIENCLKSILQQTYPSEKLEIIVVDNNSSDKTKEIALSFCHPERSKGSHIHIYNKDPERSAQRNFGAKMAQGKYYLYLDADMILSPGIIEESVNRLEKNSSLIALYIPEIVIGDSFWSNVRRFERSFYNATVIDCVRFVRIEDFLAVEGFDTSMSGPEDWDFDKKLRNVGQTGLIESPIYHNEGGFNLKRYLNKKQYYAQSFEKYIGKWGKDDPDVKKQFGLWYRYFEVFLENGKWKKLIAHPVLSLGMYFLRFIVGICFLIYKSKLLRNLK